MTLRVSHSCFSRARRPDAARGRRRHRQAAAQGTERSAAASGAKSRKLRTNTSHCGGGSGLKISYRSMSRPRAGPREKPTRPAALSRRRGPCASPLPSGRAVPLVIFMGTGSNLRRNTERSIAPVWNAPPVPAGAAAPHRLPAAGLWQRDAVREQLRAFFVHERESRDPVAPAHYAQTSPQAHSDLEETVQSLEDSARRGARCSGAGLKRWCFKFWGVVTPPNSRPAP